MPALQKTDGVSGRLTNAIRGRPPGPKGKPVLGVLREFRADPPVYLEKVARQYGDLVYLPVGRQHIYLLNHPDLVRDVLVTNQHRFKKSRILERARILLGDGLLTSEGSFHRRQRRLAQPAFHRDRLAGYAAIMAARAEAASAGWQPGEHLDAAREMMHLTLDIVSRALFSAEVDSEADEIGAALNEVFEMFDMILMPFSEWLAKLPLPSVLRFHRARKRLDQTIYRLIAERRASGQDTGDLLSMLLLARDEEAEAGSGDGASGNQMTDQQVRDEALTLFLAGHETTAQALTWSWYLLSQHPEAEARFHAELDRVLGAAEGGGSRTPGFEDLRALPYTEAVFMEALRLYPPAWAIGRKALEDYEAGGYRIPEGSILLSSAWVMHRDPRWFADPEQFRPERWLVEDAEGMRVERPADLPKFAYFPFGGGARVCIGERFAMMEGVVVLAAVARRWSFRLEPGHPVAHRAGITLRTRHGMRMIAEPRQGVGFEPAAG